MKFDLRLAFPVLQDDIEHVEKTVFSLGSITRLHGRARAAGLLNLTIVGQYPMIVELDGEVWRSVDRTSYDAALVVVKMPLASLPDDVLLRLPEYDEHRRAAQWAVANNHWFIEMKRFRDEV